MLAEHGRVQVAGPAARVGVVVQADHRSGDLDGAEHRVVDLHDQALATSLIPVVDAIQRADFTGGHAQGIEPREQVGQRDVRERALQGRRDRWRCKKPVRPADRQTY